MANRVWLHLFGEGIVRSPEDFGSTGLAPSHPALLDHLALSFMESGWSVKALIRELVLSRVYRLSSDHAARAFRADPDNLLLWRAHARRLDAEALRDAMLRASGELDLERPRASSIARLGHMSLAGRVLEAIDLDAPVSHRSVYLPVVRDATPRALDVFDFAEPSMAVGRRESTSTPSQALYLMNNPFVLARSDALAERLRREERGDRARVKRAFLLVYGRPAEEREVERCLDFLRAFQDEAEGSKELALSALCQSLFASAEFLYLN